jgi:hypothetical protein
MAYAFGEHRGVVARGRGLPCSGCLGRRLLSRPVPWQQFVDAIGGVIGDAGEHVSEPGLGIDVVESGGGDQAVDDGGAVATTIGAGEQPGLAAERNHPVILPISAVWTSCPAAPQRAAPRRPLCLSRGGTRRGYGGCGLDAGSCHLRRNGDRRAAHGGVGAD